MDPNAIYIGTDWDIFISHASEDRADFVVPLAHALRSRGLKVWIDQLDIPYIADQTMPSEEVKTVLIDSLHMSQVIVFVVSESYLRKAWPLFELETTLKLLASGGNVPRLALIWHQVEPRQAQRSHRSIRTLLNLSSLSVNSNEQLNSIATKLFRQVNVRPSLVHKKYQGGTRIDIFESTGEVIIHNTQSAGKEFDLTMDVFEFSGLSLFTQDAEPSDNRRFFKSLLFEADYPSDKPVEGFTQQFRDWLIYVQVNVGYSSEDEVKRKVLYNFPTESTDRPIRPFYATPYFTAGALNESSVRDMQYWLSCVGEFPGRWRRMCVVGDKVEFDTFSRLEVAPGEFWIP